MGGTITLQGNDENLPFPSLPVLILAKDNV